MARFAVASIVAILSRGGSEGGLVTVYILCSESLKQGVWGRSPSEPQYRIFHFMKYRNAT